MKQTSSLLSVNHLQASVDNKPILKGLNLEVKAGEIHAIMGPNGSGKSTFANVLAGHEDYTVSAGNIHYLGENLLDLSVEERAHKGIFLAFQYPVEIPGVNNMVFLRTALNAMRTAKGEDELSAPAFMKLIRKTLAELEMDDRLLKRAVNVGFSGGEKKRNEILQMALFQPRLAILDETDSGLDIDALRQVAKGVNKLRDPQRSMILVTHYQRLLDSIEPDYVHVMADGRIVRTGDKSLALELEDKGYSWITDEEAA